MFEGLREQVYLKLKRQTNFMIMYRLVFPLVSLFNLFSCCKSVRNYTTGVSTKTCKKGYNRSGLLCSSYSSYEQPIAACGKLHISTSPIVFIIMMSRLIMSNLNQSQPKYRSPIEQIDYPLSSSTNCQMPKFQIFTLVGNYQNQAIQQVW